jgi:ABC-type transport system involved in multi-copper enzyme maturation permease subunit
MTGVTFGRVARSEWTKLRSLRSTWIILGCTAILTVAFSAAFGHGYGGQIRSDEVTPSLDKAIDVTFIGLDLSALIIGVFGILQMTGEYGCGLIRASLTAVPRRWPVLLTKALVLAAVTAAVMGPTCLAAFGVCQAMIGDHGAGLGDPGAVRAVLGATGYAVAMGLLGLGLGAALRHTAVAITVFVATLLILPAMLGPALPEGLEHRLLPYVPIAAAQAVYTQVPDGSGPFTLLSPWPGLFVLLGWVIAVLTVGIVVLTRRDA